MSNKKFTDVELIKRIASAGRDFSFSSKDKSEIKTNLMAVIKSDNIRIQEQSNTSNIFNTRRKLMPIIPVLIAAIIALGGSTAALADTAKPGDALYPVDQWVEQMQERFAFSKEAKAGLFARLSEERIEELGGLLNIDPTTLSAERQAMWEEHKANALARVASSIERAEAIRDYFEAKISENEDANQVKAYEIVINRMDEIITRRELKVDDIEAGRKLQGPTTGQKEIREQIREFMGDNSEIFNEIHEEIAQQFGVGGFGPKIAPNPYPLDPEFNEQTSEQWRELQREMARQRQEWAEKIRKQFENGEIEWSEKEGVIPQPQPLTGTQTQTRNGQNAN